MGINSSMCPVCGDYREPEMVECPDCGGTGYSEYYAVNIDTNEETEVTQLVWDMIPKMESEARASRQRFIKGEREICPTCGGEGEVEDGDYDDGPEYDEDAAMERYYEAKYGRE